jgi:capsular polysaccharide biosynthesis protein
MEGEIDPRYYAGVVTKYRKWILALIVAAMVLAALFSMRVPAQSYEAVATLSLHWAALDRGDQAQDALQVASLNEAVLVKQAKKVLGQIIGELGASLPTELRTVAALDDLCTVSLGGTRDSVQLRVRYGEYQVAAEIANSWARLLVQRVNRRYGPSANIEAQVLRIVSPARPAAMLTSVPSLANIALAGTLALIGGVLAAFIVGYLRQPFGLHGEA